MHPEAKTQFQSVSELPSLALLLRLIGLQKHVYDTTDRHLVVTAKSSIHHTSTGNALTGQ